MNGKRPLIVTLIGDLTFFYALFYIVSLFPKFIQGFGIELTPLPIISNPMIRIIMIAILLVASYGYLKLKLWGYWIVTSMNIFFLVIYIIFFISGKEYFIQGIISGFISLIFILPTRKYFVKSI
ncbi:hypothetical protein Curi_c20380 [Gottschalkia acidurici 9a]|uniref:Uncharacterized protein n=1 Tax=Gottschalkia acidurici (strain ATCC 7906 / DSM 604 / BCRC 14475 / CIP 104303 / KCTC 5404 / NCIMB 10678 / 9a) TaxID=1128398 RepID=K0B1Q1_GOTA9|nr:hypothetical protein [Gottschalkia acidurici]AFS79042.1 hypothetical protein Curi_c20380 [Gottschalkia acidurici 9a]